MEEADGGNHWNALCLIEGTFKGEHEVAAHHRDALLLPCESLSLDPGMEFIAE